MGHGILLRLIALHVLSFVLVGLFFVLTCRCYFKEPLSAAPTCLHTIRFDELGNPVTPEGVDAAEWQMELPSILGLAWRMP